jgi:hypothetical protein
MLTILIVFKGDLAHDVLLQLGTTLDTMSNISFVEGQIKDIQDIILPLNTNARFIQLVRTREMGFFHLCEVEVLGKIGKLN